MGLDLFLIALPFSAFVIGCATVLRAWRNDPQLRAAARDAIASLRVHLSALLIAGATLLAGAILSVVALHIITD